MTNDKNSPFTAEEIDQVFQSDNIAKICETLVELAFYDEDWKKVEGYCLQFLEHPDAGVRMVAATCIGHLARIHQQLDLDLVLPALYRHQSDSGKYVAGNVDNALSCIERFMHVTVKRDPAMRDENVVDVVFEEDDEEEKPPTAEEVEQAFHSDDEMMITRTLLGLALYDPDWRKTEGYCLQFMEYPAEDVRGFAVDCLIRVLYRHKQLDLDLVLPALYRHRSDPSKYVIKNVDSALIYIANILKVPVEPMEVPENRDDKKYESIKRRLDIAENEYVPIGPKPTNGQSALNNSLSILPGNKRYRIGIDLDIGEIVVFGEMEGGKYSGDVRTWNQLTQIMKNVLIENGLILENGKIILRDARGNIIGYGKNVIQGK